ncbi:hypothetical protein GIB67_031343 [Kingdonia uniflora]|uniref:SOSEKI DIX-like domain-containing protein n=1 Tax=Kingdonia uniflora TaxID=39325 RepID=A0A7J7MGY6_9MAGN|nr:hypothetical protein GIB67_031343 [Kingdonia uniflora]
MCFFGKDVLDRLTALRGKGMPTLFSWSCKRSYKNGYVWNDLADNDVIYPTEGAEFILKGSELIEGCAERFLQFQGRGNNSQQNPEPNFHSKLKPPVGAKHREQLLELEFIRQEEQEHEQEEEYEEKRSNSSSNTPYSQRSRGVSTDEIEELENSKTVNHNKNKNNNHNPIEITHEDGSPPSSSSNNSEKTNESNNDSQRLELCDSVVDEPVVSRNSVFFQLIACGSSLPVKGKNTYTIARKSVNSLHREILRKTTSKAIQNDEINYMSENPRFGNLQSEEKEYFSGSIVESITEDRVANGPSLKKSSSYNEERSSKSGLGEVMEIVEEKSLKGKCIPRMICSSKQSKK